MDGADLLRTLYLMRHATAANTGTDGTDHSRPLSPKGKLEAEVMGKFLRRSGIVLDGAACSTAIRARETAESVLRAAGSKLKPLLVPELYNATGDSLLRWLQMKTDDDRKLLVVAHMPGVAEMISVLVTEGANLAMGFSPATLVAVECNGATWADWDYGKGLLQMVMPAAAAVGK
jgi:phosphohistidine phosphatase